MSEFIVSQILRLKNGDKLIVDRGDKPGVIIFAVAEGSRLNIHLDSAMHVVAHDEDSVSRAFVELQLFVFVGDAPVMVHASAGSKTSTTIEPPTL